MFDTLAGVIHAGPRFRCCVAVAGLAQDAGKCNLPKYVLIKCLNLLLLLLHRRCWWRRPRCRWRTRSASSGSSSRAPSRDSSSTSHRFTFSLCQWRKCCISLGGAKIIKMCRKIWNKVPILFKKNSICAFLALFNSQLGPTYYSSYTPATMMICISLN